MVQSIRAAEERYRAENRQYLNVSGTLTNYYPHAPDGLRRPFFKPSADTDPTNRLWWMLNPTSSGLVQFGYAVVAGPSGVAMTQPTGLDMTTNWPMPTDSWYVIQAAADNDGDHVYCVVIGTSINGEVYVENEGE